MMKLNYFIRHIQLSKCAFCHTLQCESEATKDLDSTFTQCLKNVPPLACYNFDVSRF